MSTPVTRPVDPIPPSYDLPTTLKLLGLSSPTLFKKTGLEAAIRRTNPHYPLYAAEEVRDWARRIGRLRIRQAWGEVAPTGRGNRLVDAPTDTGRDVTCPKCGEFAQLEAGSQPGQIRCLRGHVSPAVNSGQTRLTPPSPARSAPR